MDGLNLKKRGGIPLFLLMKVSSSHMLDDDGDADQDEDGSSDDIGGRTLEVDHPAVGGVVAASILIAAEQRRCSADGNAGPGIGVDNPAEPG